MRVARGSGAASVVSLVAAAALAVAFLPFDAVTARGADVICGGGGDDRLIGGAGDDEIRGGDGDDVIRRGDGDDKLRGDAGDDFVRGGDGSDTLRGGDGDDVVGGGEGDDKLRGDAGDDFVRGGDGDDILRGVDAERFVDLLRCGPGADRVFADMSDTVAAHCENVVQNDAPTDVSLSPSSVAENQPAGTVVGQLAAVDPDPGDTHTFRLVTGPGSDDNSSFAIDGDDLETAVSLDFEADGQLSIRVRATDAEGATDTKSLTVTVTDESDNPPVAVDDSYTTDEDTLLTLPVTGSGGPAENDTDADGDTL